MYRVNYYLSLNDLTVNEKLYAGLALFVIGDQQRARQLLEQVLENQGEDLGDSVRVNVGTNMDDTLQSTALATLLAGMLLDDHHSRLFHYIEQNNATDLWIGLERVVYAKKSLSRAPVASGSFRYRLNDLEKT